MNETLNVLETRRSVRGFDPERMPSDELIEQVCVPENMPLRAEVCSRHEWW